MISTYTDCRTADDRILTKNTSWNWTYWGILHSICVNFLIQTSKRLNDIVTYHINGICNNLQVEVKISHLLFIYSKCGWTYGSKINTCEIEFKEKHLFSHKKRIYFWIEEYILVPTLPTYLWNIWEFLQ